MCNVGGSGGLTSNGNVERHEGDDWHEEQKLQRADDGLLEFLSRGGRLIGKLAAQVGVTGLLAETGRLALKDNRGIRLLQGEESEHSDDTSNDGDQPIHPSPTSRTNEVATSNGADSRTKQRTQGPGSHGATTHFDGHHVRNAARADGDGYSTGQTHEEAESHHHADVLAEGGADGEDGEEQVAQVVQQRAAVDLTHGGDDQGAEGEAQDVDRHDEGRSRLGAYLELLQDPGDAGGEHGGAQGAVSVSITQLTTRNQKRAELT